MNRFERRERSAQRETIGRLLAESEDVSLLRTASGEVVIFDEQEDRRRPVNVRAVVMPDGSLREFERDRFTREG